MQVIIQDQVNTVSRKAVYDRLDEKLSRLEIDPFFYWEQVGIYVWRRNYLMKNWFNPENYDHLDLYHSDMNFIITQKFGRVLDLGQSFDPTSAREQSEWWSDQRAWEATAKFLTPKLIYRWLSSPHPAKLVHLPQTGRLEARLCDCFCCEVHISRLRERLKQQPEAAVLGELLIRTFHPNNEGAISLKQRAIRRVLELGLPQDTLPITEVPVKHIKVDDFFNSDFLDSYHKKNIFITKCFRYPHFLEKNIK